ncbi:MAG: hypothetical protein QOD40_2171 [Alphaproteobacteria bacterium]|nr:hypothetical protein [Alphaproteobacteria bacterium]
MVENAGQKIRFARGIPNLGGAYSGNRKEAAKPLFILGDECKGLNGQHFRCFSRDRKLP